MLWLLLLCNKLPPNLLAYNYLLRLIDFMDQEFRQGTVGMVFLCSRMSMVRLGR